MLGDRGELHMLSNIIATRMERRGFHYGWMVVGATFLTMLVMAGAVGAPGVFLKPLEREFGWNSAQISGALALRFVLFGLVGPFAAALMNRFGVRRMMLIALVVVDGGMLASIFMTRLWQLMLLWGVVAGIGTGLTAIVLGATVATRWFSARRGLVMGLLSASTATGQLAFMPLLAVLTQRFGWRVALGMLCMLLAAAGIAVLLVMRDRPSDMALPPYGESRIAPAPMREGNLLAALAAPVRVLGEAAMAPTFWILLGTFFVCGASTNGLIQTHFIALCGDFGMAAVGAAGLLAVMGLFDFVGTVGSGWLSDRYDNRLLLFGYYALRGLSLMYLPFSGFGLYGLSIFAIFYGLDWVATVPPTVKLTADRFGPDKTNIVFGWIFAGHQLGAAFGAGLVRTAYSSYLPAFFFSGTLCMLAALSALLIGRNGPGRSAAA